MNAESRLKVKADTFFLPGPDGTVYFRSNSASFRMEGSMIDRWMEKLIPVFNGEHTMEQLTEGLPLPHRNRIYEIGDTLLQNGFARDVNEDVPHQLAYAVVQKFASQIEFLDQMAGSGGHRFQSIRQANVLAVGEGTFLASLVSALLESGLPKLRVLLTNPEPRCRQRIEELAKFAKQTDPEVELAEIPLSPKDAGFDWRQAVRPFDCILYVSGAGDSQQLRSLSAACREERKTFLPALIVRQAGVAGPFSYPDSEIDWESAWRRLHETAVDRDPELHAVSSTAEAMLANVIAFEWFKSAAGVTGAELKDQLFLLNLETLEGSRHPVLAHPLVTKPPRYGKRQPHDFRLERNGDDDKRNGLLPMFSRITSDTTGIFHVWDEGGLRQLPLSQCRVQVADPLSDGPAGLLPEMVFAAFTHEEARREAGLAGLECYLERLSPYRERIGIGVGESGSEAVGRGLHKYLVRILAEQSSNLPPSIVPVELEKVEDERCGFYLRSLNHMVEEPLIGLGEPAQGFPVVWVGTGDRWYGSVGFNLTMAFRYAILMALMKAQNEYSADPVMFAVGHPAVRLVNKPPRSVVIASSAGTEHEAALFTALDIVKQQRHRIVVYELETESCLQDALVGAFGVALREEESP